MCATIYVLASDGSTTQEIESIRADGKCLCNSTDAEILMWIVENLVPQQQMDIGTIVTIERTPTDWEVTVRKRREDNHTFIE